MAEEVSNHIDHKNHGVEYVEAGCNDRIPEALRVDLVRTWWNVDVHASRDGDKDTACDIEEDDGGWQCHDVSQTPSEVEQEEEAYKLIENLKDPDININLDQVMDELLEEGIEKFVQPFQSLTNSLEEKINQLSPV